LDVIDKLNILISNDLCRLFLLKSSKLDIEIDKEENEPLERMEVDDAVEQHHEVE